MHYDGWIMEVRGRGYGAWSSGVFGACDGGYTPRFDVDVSTFARFAYWAVESLNLMLKFTPFPFYHSRQGID